MMEKRGVIDEHTPPEDPAAVAEKVGQTLSPQDIVEQRTPHPTTRFAQAAESCCGKPGCCGQKHNS